ncbi:MAG: M23 family metallopeptidase [Amphritea sp.]
MMRIRFNSNQPVTTNFHGLRWLLLTLIYWQHSALANDIQLEWPLDCSIGQDCWIVNHVDTNPAPKQAKDYTCGNLTYDAHKGTDIALQDSIAMANGVDVLAPMNGTVLHIRNNESDHTSGKIDLAAIRASGKECGNGLILDHGNGWQSKYCHMKQGSLVVKPGDRVTTGQKLGKVGLSGLTQFPHLHIGIEHNGKVIDPFTGLSHQEGCNKMQTPLWAKELALGYTPASLYAAGFSAQVPNYSAVVEDTSSPSELPVSSPVLTFWLLMFGAEKGDQISIEIRDPKGNLFSQNTISQAKKKIRLFNFIGKRNTTAPLQQGTYTGTVTLKRQLTNGEIITREITRTVAVK